MPASSNLTKNLLKNASWLFSGSMATSLFASAELVLIVRFLGVEQFGLFSLVIAYVGIVNGLIDLKSPEAVVRYVGQYRELGERDKTLSFIKFFYLLDFLVGVVALGCVFFSSEWQTIFLSTQKMRSNSLLFIH